MCGQEPVTQEAAPLYPTELTVRLQAVLDRYDDVPAEVESRASGELTLHELSCLQGNIAVLPWTDAASNRHSLYSVD